MTYLVDLITGPDLIWSVLLRFFVTLLVLTIFIYGVYRRNATSEDHSFAFFQMGIIIFLVCILLKTVEIQMGMALGLFAIFAILRFRTVNLPVKTMTYFFTVLGISVINAMAVYPNPVRGAILINTVIILSSFLLELITRKTSLSKTKVTLRNMELVQQGHTDKLLKELSLQTGLKVARIEIIKIDLIKEQVEIELYYREN